MWRLSKEHWTLMQAINFSSGGDRDWEKAEASTLTASQWEREREREGKNVGERSNKKKMPHLREGGKKFVAAKNN